MHFLTIIPTLVILTVVGQTFIRDARGDSGFAVPASARSSFETSPHLKGKIQLHGLPKSKVPVVTAVALQPRGRLVVTAGDDHIVRLWDATTGRLARELRGHKDWVSAVAFSRDGSEVITGGRDGRVLVWDAETGRAKRSLGEHVHPITSIVVADKTDIVAVGEFRAPLKIYDLATGKRMSRLTCPCTDVRAIAFSPSMKFVAAAGRNGVIRIWNLADGTKRDIKAHALRVTSLVFTADDQLLSASEDKAIRLWDAADGQAIRSFTGNSGKVLSMKLVDNRRFAAATTDNVIRLFNLDDADPESVLRGHTGSIAALDYRNQTLYSGSFDTTVRVWSVDLNRNSAMTKATTLDVPNGR